MPTDFRSVDVLCPFYLKEDKMKISCEGIADGSTIQQTFKTMISKETQKKIFCNQHYRSCELCRALFEKYDYIEKSGE